MQEEPKDIFTTLAFIREETKMSLHMIHAYVKKTHLNQMQSFRRKILKVPFELYFPMQRKKLKELRAGSWKYERIKKDSRCAIRIIFFYVKDFLRKTLKVPSKRYLHLQRKIQKVLISTHSLKRGRHLKCIFKIFAKIKEDTKSTSCLFLLKE